VGLGHYVYTVDGAGTLGVIIEDETLEKLGQVKFVTCTGVIVAVLRTHLRPTKEVCSKLEPWPPGPPIATTQDGLLPVYRAEGDSSDTKVKVAGSTVDLAEIDLENVEGAQNRPPEALLVHYAAQADVVGYVFNDSVTQRRPLMILLTDNAEAQQQNSPVGPSAVGAAATVPK